LSAKMGSKSRIGSMLKDLIPEEIELALDDGHKLIKIAEKLGAQATEVFMIKAIGTDFSIEKDTVKFASSSTEFGMGIRVIKNKRLGFGYCTSLDNAEQAIKNALDTSKLGEEIAFDFIAKAEHQDMAGIFDKALIELSAEEGLDFVQQLIAASKDFDKRVIITGGGVGFGGGSIALVTSNDIELKYSSTGIFGGISTLLRDKTVSTGFEYSYSRKNDLDYLEIGKRAAELAVSGQNPKQIEPGHYPIIFTPYAFAELLEFTIIPALYGEQALKGETLYSNRLDSEVMATELTVVDDGRLANGINTAPWDDEGTLTQENTLIDKGILKKFLFDKVSSIEFDETSTGNAMRAEGLGGGRSYRASPKTKAHNFMVTGPGKTLDELTSEISNGLIVYELLGAHTANQASGDFSVNTPTLFQIKDGAISNAGKQVMISGNMGKLMEQVLGLGDDLKLLSGGLTPVAFYIPSISIDNVKVI
jgi:PmbA protein